MRPAIRNFLVSLCADFLGGVFIGVVHASLLAAAGLYIAESGSLFALSFLRYCAIFGVLSATLGGCAHLLARLARRPDGGPLGSPLLFALYLALWALILAREAQRGSATALAAAIVLLLVALAMLLRVARFFLAGGVRARSGRLAVATGAVFLVAAPGLILAPAPSKTVSLPAPVVVTPLARDDLPRRNILLLTYDTLRADHLGCYGYGRATSPAIDSLATSGTLLTRAHCQRPKTSPSFATILTGTYPVAHGIHAPKQLLQPGNLTLAEILSEAGYRSGASVTNGNLYPEFGFDQGFDDYLHGHKDAKTGAQLARAWLDQHGDAAQPWFLWVHFTDPHTPYDPDPPFDTMFESGATEEPAASIDRYDGEIRYCDTQSRWLLSWLHEHPEIQAQTLVLFTADHGESLGEHGYFFEHGLHPYEPSAHIPLIFSASGLVPAKVRIESRVGAVDLLPTLLDLVGIATPEQVQGRSFAPLLLGESTTAGRDHVFLEAGYGDHIGPGRTRALLRGDTKYVDRLRQWAQWPRTPRQLIATVDAWFEGSLAEDELYNLREDPGETRNLLRARPRLAEKERAALESVAAQLMRDARASIELNPESLDAETTASLRSLGYIE
jgi:arylsulfatase A-like enzyme